MKDHSASATHENRVCIVGCGRVGMASAYALIQSSFIREIVLVGRDREKTEGEVMDLEHAVAVPMKSPINVINGSYADAAASSIVVDANAPIVREIVGKLRDEGFDGVLVMASNPVDLLVQVALEESGLPAGRVIGTGTLVDTARLRGMLAEAFDIEPRGVDAYIIGEHGDSEVAVWSGARIAGVPLNRCAPQEPQDYARMLERVRRAAPEVVRRKGHTEYAIGLCVQRICEAVLRNEHAVLAVSTVLGGEYGLTGVCLGTPCVVGKNGIERIIQLDLDDGELAALHRSAETLQRLHPRMSADAA